MATEPQTEPQFVHLRVHTEYSINDGIVRINEAVARCLEMAMPALAITDLANMFATIKFCQATRQNGIKPIIGLDTWVTNEDQEHQSSRLLLLCQDETGYRNLCWLISEAYRQNRRQGRAEIRKSWLVAPHTEGLLALSGAHLGEIGLALLAGDATEASRLAGDWQQRFPGRFYIELQRSGLVEQENYNQAAVQLALAQDLPVVATHPVQFLDAGDFQAHEARVCIAEGRHLNDRRRPRNFTVQQYFKSPAEMAELFSDLPQALANTVEIARRCNFCPAFGQLRLPQFPTPAGQNLDEYLIERTRQGFHDRLRQLYPDETERMQRLPAYQARIRMEIQTIVEMGFSGYYLIVADFIQWARDNGVPVGPGRGSGAGSLVAYCLKITDLDPLKYDLLFERFLNPERVSMPDFDIDFCMDGRERVIDYVKQKYGSESVSQIATFGTMAARAVIRDVGRVLDVPYLVVDGLAKLVPNEPGMTLARARGLEPQIDQYAEANTEIRELLDLAGKLEGLTRSVGMHAGGVLIAPGKITDFAPVYVDDEAAVLSQYDKDDVERIGLVKFDFLGLRTLTILDWAMRFLKNLGVEPFDLNNLPLDDKKTYDLLKRCDTTAVFQLESRGMKDLIKRLQPDCFEDIVALVALFRPGPLGSGMVDDFINRKHGRQKADYFHPKLEETLKPTYGIILYQEQVMLIAQVLAGYSLGGADMLRRAMGKKKAEEMARHREIFTQGATERGVDPALAGSLFDLMEKFAEYGFNKSHSAAYALVAYQTAYLKAHYPAAFMAATLSSDMDDTDKVRIFCEDCRDSGLTLLPPDVNQSDYRFVPVSMQEIRFGLGAIKGVGEGAIASLVGARQAGGPFKDLFDFCNRVDRRIVNKRAIEALIRAGAFDTLAPNRASLLASTGMAMEFAREATAVHQGDLFGRTSATTPALLQATAWGDKEKLQQEKISLGFYFSGHLYAAYQAELEGLALTPLAQLAKPARSVWVAGIIIAVRSIRSKKGPMAFVTLEDGTAQREVAIFSGLYAESRARIKEDQLLVVEGRVTVDPAKGVRLAANQVFDWQAATRQLACRMVLKLAAGIDAGVLLNLLRPHTGGRCTVQLSFASAQAQCDLVLGEEWRVTVSDPLLKELASCLQEDNIRLSFKAEGAAAINPYQAQSA